jgi:hypothetical protein
VGFTEAQNGTSVTLTASDGIHTAHIELLGQYAASQFTKQSDANGGTVIMVDPQPNPPVVVPPHNWRRSCRMARSAKEPCEEIAIPLWSGDLRLAAARSLSPLFGGRGPG